METSDRQLFLDHLYGLSTESGLAQDEDTLRTPAQVLAALDEVAVANAETRRDAYDAGYEDGYDTGYDTGYSRGYDEGVKEGNA